MSHSDRIDLTIARETRSIYLEPPQFSPQLCLRRQLVRRRSRRSVPSKAATSASRRSSSRSARRATKVHFFADDLAPIARNKGSVTSAGAFWPHNSCKVRALRTFSTTCFFPARRLSDFCKEHYFPGDHDCQRLSGGMSRSASTPNVAAAKAPGIQVLSTIKPAAAVVAAAPVSDLCAVIWPAAGIGVVTLAPIFFLCLRRCAENLHETRRRTAPPLLRRLLRSSTCRS